jgi:hypothetical protein
MFEHKRLAYSCVSIGICVCSRSVRTGLSIARISTNAEQNRIDAPSQINLVLCATLHFIGNRGAMSVDLAGTEMTLNMRTPTDSKAHQEPHFISS